jgi:hypothetical protein
LILVDHAALFLRDPKVPAYKELTVSSLAYSPG